MLLGMLQAGLRAEGLGQDNNIIVVSDHGRWSVSGRLATFPTAAITAGAVGATDATKRLVGLGDVRLANILSRVGAGATFPNVYDGDSCMYVPAMSGVDRGRGRRSIRRWPSTRVHGGKRGAGEHGRLHDQGVPRGHRARCRRAQS